MYNTMGFDASVEWDDDIYGFPDENDKGDDDIYGFPYENDLGINTAIEDLVGAMYSALSEKKRV